MGVSVVGRVLVMGEERWETRRDETCVLVLVDEETRRDERRWTRARRRRRGEVGPVEMSRVETQQDETSVLVNETRRNTMRRNETSVVGRMLVVIVEERRDETSVLVLVDEDRRQDATRCDERCWTRARGR